MFSAACVCVFVSMITSERENIGWWTWGVGALYENLGRVRMWGHSPLGVPPKMWHGLRRWENQHRLSGLLSNLINYCIFIQNAETASRLECDYIVSSVHPDGTVTLVKRDISLRVTCLSPGSTRRAGCLNTLWTSASVSSESLCYVWWAMSSLRRPSQYQETVEPHPAATGLVRPPTCLHVRLLPGRLQCNTAKLSALTSVSTSTPWAVRLSWLANAYSRPPFSAGNFDPKSRSDRPSFWHAFRVH